VLVNGEGVEGVFNNFGESDIVESNPVKINKDPEIGDL
jgi:hypothetical protein